MSATIARALGALVVLAPVALSAQTTLLIVQGSGEFRSLEKAATVSVPEAISLQWSTTLIGAVGANWQVTTSKIRNRVQVVATGSVTPAPKPGHVALFTIAANAFLRPTPPDKPVKYSITIAPFGAQNTPLGSRSAAVVVTQIKAGPAPTFGRSAVFPNLMLVHYGEQIGVVPQTQLRYALGAVKVRVVNDRKAVTDPLWLSVRDHHVLMRQDAQDAASIPSLKPGASIEATLKVKAVLPPPQSQLPEEQQYRQWRKQYQDRGGVDLRGIMSYRGPQAKAPMNPERQVTLYRGLGDSTSCQEGKLTAILPPDVPICMGNQCISIREVTRTIHERLGCRTVGYSFFVGRSPKFEASGQARTAANSPARDFTSATKMPVASVSKVVTALAAVRVLANNNVGLAEAIGPYFPSDWAVDANVAKITFQELLSHTSGIKDYGNNAQDYATLKKFFTQEVDAAVKTTCMGAGVVDPKDPIVVDATEKAKPCYSNYNFSVFRILLPKVAGFLETDPTKLAAKYVDLVQKSVFEPVGISNVACGPPKLGSGAGAYAFSYAFPGTSAGHDWGDNTLGCGHAGWYLSVQDIAQVLISLNSQDGRVLSTTQFQNTESMQLGWDMTTFNGYRFVEKNGGWGAGGTSLSTSIAVIGPAPGIVGVLFINSDITREPNVGADIVLRQAVMKALRPKQ